MLSTSKSHLKKKKRPGCPPPLPPLLTGMLIQWIFGYEDEDHIFLVEEQNRQNLGPWMLLDQSCLKNLNYLLLNCYVREKHSVILFELLFLFLTI